MNPEQKLVCINKEGWHDDRTKEEIQGPQYNEIYTFDGNCCVSNNLLYLYLKEFSHIAWDSRGFVPIEDLTKQIEEALKKPGLISYSKKPWMY